MSHPAQTTRPLPHSIEAERSVLGGVLLDNEVLAEVGGALETRDFYRAGNGRIWETMLELHEENHPIDLLTLTERLKQKNWLEDVGGVDYLAALDTQVPTAAHAETYARIVRDRAIVRRLVQAADSISQEGTTGAGDAREFIDEAEAKIFQITQAQDDRDLVHLKDVTVRVFDILEKRLANQSDITGIATGYEKLDKMTAGFQRGDLLILAARPSMGKTALALNIASNAALRKQEAKVAIFSMEMSTESLVMRMLASEARVPSDQLRTGRIRAPNGWGKLASAADKLTAANIFIDDTPAITLQQLRSKCRRMKAKVGLDLVLVDYLQLMKGPKSDSREQEISRISRGLKAMAMDMQVPVVALSQLNRSLERRENKRPQLSDLRESGAIEQDADVIMFIHREDRYQQGEEPANDAAAVAEIIIAKQRNGPTGAVEVVFFQEFTRFDNMAEAEA